VNWENAARYDWSGPISNQAAKEEVARRIAENVQDGDVVGVGSGSTSYLAIQAIAKRVHRDKLRISAICTSHEITLACAKAKLPVTTLLERCPDWAFDGADEVDRDHSLIKGRGGALFLEKVVMRAAPKTFILVDQTKMVERLGEKFAIPVEFHPVSLHIVERALRGLGASDIALRRADGKDGPVITETGNLLFDVKFREIGKGLERDLKAITGVVESGLFIGHPVEIVMA
jgi:ribose 5-phosphate isomerase A